MTDNPAQYSRPTPHAMPSADLKVCGDDGGVGVDGDSARVDREGPGWLVMVVGVVVLAGANWAGLVVTQQGELWRVDLPGAGDDPVPGPLPAPRQR